MNDYARFLQSHSVMLAPMAGVSDIAMRQLCIEEGAQLTFTEMVSAKGLSYANKKTADLLETAANEQQVGVQLFGHEAAVMADQAKWIHDTLGDKLAVIDINMGCPARKIVSKGDGSSLMQRPAEAAEIVKAVSTSVSVPVTVKFRRGYEMDNETAVEFARTMEQAGAWALCVHGRYAQQMYQGRASWESIARVKQAVGIPVIGNGDITCGADAVYMMSQTGCDAVMIARSARGNPWIFSQVRAACAGRPEPAPPTPFQRIEMARRHALLLSQRENGALVRMRKHSAWYFKGLPGAAAARYAINEASSLDDFNRVFDQLEAHIRQHDAESL